MADEIAMARKRSLLVWKGRWKRFGSAVSFIPRTGLGWDMAKMEAKGHEGNERE